MCIALREKTHLRATWRHLLYAPSSLLGHGGELSFKSLTLGPSFVQKWTKTFIFGGSAPVTRWGLCLVHNGDKIELTRPILSTRSTPSTRLATKSRSRFCRQCVRGLIGSFSALTMVPPPLAKAGSSATNNATVLVLCVYIAIVWLESSWCAIRTSYSTSWF